MSLDCIWILPKDTKSPEKDINQLYIKRSFFYANENLAFKGDLYSEWLEAILGYTLYEEIKKKEKIKEINLAISEYLKSNDLKSFKGEESELSIKEIKDFVKMWNIMTSLQADLVGWW